MSAATRGLALVAWTFLAVLLALGSQALAGGAARLLMLGPSPRDPIVVRLRQELQLLGIDVDFVAAPGPGRPDLAAAAREHAVTAVLFVEPSPPAIVLWTDPERYPDDAAGPEIRVDEGAAGSGDARLLVLRAVELLRGRLLLISARAPGPADAGTETDGSIAAPGPSSPKRTPDREPSIFLGPAVLASPGGVGATPHVWLGARWAPVRRVDLELVAFVPTTAAGVSAPEGSMTLRAGGLGAGVGARLTDPGSRLFVVAGAGLGAVLAGFEGQARAPWKAADGLRATMLPYAHACAGYWLGSRVALRADVMAGFALPEPVLSIAGRSVASFGEPAAVIALAIEVRP